MKMQHEQYANQKLSTEWGEVVCDSEGCAEIKSEAQDFFKKILKFQPIESSAKKSVAPKVEEPVVEQAEEEVEQEAEKKPSRFGKGKK